MVSVADVIDNWSYWCNGYSVCDWSGGGGKLSGASWPSSIGFVLVNCQRVDGQTDLSRNKKGWWIRSNVGMVDRTNPVMNDDE